MKEPRHGNGYYLAIVMTVALYVVVTFMVWHYAIYG